jgi:hypothetical protein
MGYSAQATNTGSFVWADAASSTAFTSTSSNQFLLRATGGVGINTNNPGGAALAVNGQVTATATGTEPFEARGAASGYSLYDRTTGAAGRWVVYALGGNLRFYNGADRMVLNNGGLTVNGTFVSSSDRNVKENFTPVQPRGVLEKVAALPLTSWNYKADSGTRHLGPMAQDFYAAFGVGPDDKHIATVDADGVALAAIQGLNEKLEQKETEITELKARLEKLEQRMQQK